jgi:hypothetical protein
MSNRNVRTSLEYCIARFKSTLLSLGALINASDAHGMSDGTEARTVLLLQEARARGTPIILQVYLL